MVTYKKNKKKTYFATWDIFLTRTRYNDDGYIELKKREYNFLG